MAASLGSGSALVADPDRREALQCSARELKMQPLKAVGYLARAAFSGLPSINHYRITLHVFFSRRTLENDITTGGHSTPFGMLKVTERRSADPVLTYKNLGDVSNPPVPAGSGSNHYAPT